VRRDFGVAPEAPGPLEQGDGAPGIAAPVADPAEAVEERRVVGPRLERAPDQALRTRELFAAIRQRVAQRIEDSAFVGPRLQQ